MSNYNLRKRTLTKAEAPKEVVKRVEKQVHGILELSHSTTHTLTCTCIGYQERDAP